MRLAWTRYSRRPSPTAKPSTRRGPVYLGARTGLAITRWCQRVAVTPPWVGGGIRLKVIAPGPDNETAATLVGGDTPLLRKGQADDVYGPFMVAFPVPVTETPDAETLAA